MNEDDTFASLKRIPYEEMQTKVTEFAFSYSMKENYNSLLSEFMKENGWDIIVFKRELQQRISKFQDEFRRRKNIP